MHDVLKQFRPFSDGWLTDPTYKIILSIIIILLFFFRNAERNPGNLVMFCILIFFIYSVKPEVFSLC